MNIVNIMEVNILTSYPLRRIAEAQCWSHRHAPETVSVKPSVHIVNILQGESLKLARYVTCCKYYLL